jgi:hypothetical protein
MTINHFIPNDSRRRGYAGTRIDLHGPILRLIGPGSNNCSAGTYAVAEDGHNTWRPVSKFELRSNETSADGCSLAWLPLEAIYEVPLQKFAQAYRLQLEWGNLDKHQQLPNCHPKNMPGSRLYCVEATKYH